MNITGVDRTSAPGRRYYNVRERVHIVTANENKKESARPFGTVVTTVCGQTDARSSEKATGVSKFLIKYRQTRAPDVSYKYFSCFKLTSEINGQEEAGILIVSNLRRISQSRGRCVQATITHMCQRVHRACKCRRIRSEKHVKYE